MDIFQYANNVRELLNKKLDEAIVGQKEEALLPEILSVPIQMDEHVARAVDVVLKQASKNAEAEIEWKCAYDTFEQHATFSIDVTSQTLETLRNVSLKDPIEAICKEVTNHLACGAKGRGAHIEKRNFKSITPENFVKLAQCLGETRNVSCHHPTIASLGDRNVHVNTLGKSPEELLNAIPQENQKPVIKIGEGDAWTPDKEPPWVSGKHLHDLTNSYGYQGPIAGSQAEKIQMARDAAKNNQEVIAM